MTDDPELMARQAAYIDRIRGLYRSERQAGFAACLLGALVMIGCRYVAGAPVWGVWLGAAMIGAGWLLFVYCIWRRTAWVRAHPFSTDG